MKKILLATTAVLGLAAAPGIAHATLTYTIITNVNATGAGAGALQANPAGFAVATLNGTTLAPQFSTVDDLNFNSGLGNTLGTFLAPANLSPGLGVNAADVMSNGANTDTTFIRITETYNDGAAPSTVVHDDGTTIFVDGLLPANLVCGTPQPQSAGAGELCTFPTAPGPHNLTLYYEESFGAPAILRVNLPTEAGAVPEPASLALLGSALIGFGVWRRRRRAG